MNEKLILIFLSMCMFLIIPLVSASNIINHTDLANVDIDDFVFWDSGDIQQNNSVILTPADNDLVTTQGWTKTGGSPIYNEDGQKMGNMSFDYTTAAVTFTYDWGAELTSVTIQHTWYDTGSTTGQVYPLFRLLNDASTEIVRAGLQSDFADGNYMYDIGAGSVASSALRTTGWHNFTYEIGPNADYMVLYIDGIFIINDTSTDGISKFWTHNGDNPATQVYMDYLMVWDGSIEDIPQPTPPAPSGFTITVTDFDNGSSVNNFTVVLSNSTDTYINFSTTGDINFENITNGIYDVRISSVQDGGYYTYTNLNYDTITDLEVNLIKFYRLFNITYSNFIELNKTNFTRNLKYDISYRCPDISNTTIDTYTNGSITEQINLTCSNSTEVFNENISYSIEGNFSIWHLLNTTYLPNIHNELIGNTSFISDLINPSVLLNFTVPEGFAAPKTNTSLICSDNIFTGNLTYNITFNDIVLTFANFTNGTNLINETDLIDGPNFLIGSCEDPFGKTTLNINRTVFNAELILIDEMDNVVFNLDNVTRARAYFDNNQSFYDFTATGSNSTNFSSSIENRLRIELIYSTGVIITRYIDMDILGREIRICANKEGITHYQQLIVSARERDVILRNIFANCIVAADSTRFAFQDSFVLQAFTISSLYSMITVRQGREIILAALDGSLETFINLDALELAETPFNLNIQPESISFEKTGTTIMQIHYLNLKSDNIALNIDITNMDTDTSVYSSSTFANLNDVTIFFDYSTLSNITNTTLFVIQADSTKATTTNSFKRYFNTNASSGIIRTELAFIISFLLVVFGLTFTATRLTLGWFGIFMLIFAIATLSFSVLTTTIVFLMAIETILLVFIFVLLSINTYSTLT